MKTLLRYYIVAFILTALCSPSSVYPQGARVTGVGPDGGIVDVIRGMANDSVVLIGTRSDGIYRSLDGGLTWSHALSSAIQVNDIVLGQHDQQLVYAATPQGLYVSGNGGGSWGLMPGGFPISTLALTPYSDSVFFAADARPQTQGGSGVLRSNNGGASWTSVSSGLPFGSVVTSLAVDLISQPGSVILYAGTDNAGVYRTGDGGTTWSPFLNNNGLTGSALRVHTFAFVSGVGLFAGTSAGEYFCPGGIPWVSISGTALDDPIVKTSEALGGAATDTIYLGTNGYESGSPTAPVRGGLYRSRNSGISWEPLFRATVDVNSSFSPAANPKKIYIGTSDGVWISVDGGASWARRNTGFSNAFVRTVTGLSSNANYLFAGVYGGGVFGSIDGGVSWNPVNVGIENPYVRVVTADPQTPGVLYAGSVYGLYKSTDTARTWQKLSMQNVSHDSLSPFNNNTEDGTLRISPVNSRNLLAVSLTGEFVVSTDAGSSWTSIVPPQKIVQSNLVENIEFDPVNPSTVYFSANGLWKSTDLGKTWSSISGDLPLTTVVGGSPAQVLCIHPRVDPKNQKVLYLPTIVGSTLLAVYRSTNGGTNWSSMGIAGYDIVVDTGNSARLICDGPGGILRSSDAGSTWNDLGGDPSFVYYSINTSASSAGLAYVGSNRGVVRVDYGSSVTALENLIDFGTQTLGAASTKTIDFVNRGPQVVSVAFSSVAGSTDFSVVGLSAPLSIGPGGSSSVTVRFLPSSTGALQATLTFTSTDPTAPAIVVKVQGTSVAKPGVTRTVLVETTHGISSNLPSGAITSYLSRLIQALQGGGISVITGVSPFDPTAAHYDAVLIGAPSLPFTPTEVSKLQQYVTNGGFVVLLADSGASPGNSVINNLLTNFQWAADPPYIPTGLLLNNDVVYDYSHNDLGNATYPEFSTFTDSTSPFLRGVDTLVIFGGTSISLSSGATPFLRGGPASYALTSDSLKRRTDLPVVAATSRIGKGTILLIGDLDVWSNISSSDPAANPLMGLLAGKNLQFALNVFGFTQSYTVKVPNPTPSDQYQIISVPYDLADANILDVLKDLGSVDPTKWRLYGHWDGSEYQEFPSQGFLTFKRGEGYWLITKGSEILTLGSASVYAAQDFYPIQLDSGYNMIGNPFPYEVSWSASRRPGADSVEQWLWRFDGTGFQQEANVMQPFTGYFLKSLRRGVTIYINPEDVSSGGAMPKSAGVQRELAQGEWELRINASDGASTDNYSAVGALRSASDLWDANDYSEPPPAPSGYLMLSFNHADWKDYPGRYAGDFRALHPEGNFWDFDIASARDGATVSLRFDPVGTLPPGFRIALVDMTTERVEDITSSLSYSFTYIKHESDRAMRLVVGSNDFIANNTDGIPVIPLESSLDQNFPNPFNPTTTIGYTLGHSSHVVLTVFNLVGQKVRTLFEGIQRIGTYSAVWDGTDDRGGKCASGVYFYRIQTEQFSAVRKLVLLK